MTDSIKQGVTVEEQMQFGEDEWIEIDDGFPVRTENMAAAGYLHILIIEIIYEILKKFVDANNLGRVHSDGLTYNLSVDEDGHVIKSRIPDVSFIRRANLKQFDYTKPYPGFPDLAVEVVSPTESAEDLQGKIIDYHTAGTEQVWVVYASSKSVHVYDRDNPESVRVYHADDTLEAATLFPGLTITVADLFVFAE